MGSFLATQCFHEQNLFPPTRFIWERNPHSLRNLHVADYQVGFDSIFSYSSCCFPWQRLQTEHKKRAGTFTAAVTDLLDFDFAQSLLGVHNFPTNKVSLSSRDLPTPFSSRYGMCPTHVSYLSYIRQWLEACSLSRKEGNENHNTVGKADEINVQGVISGLFPEMGVFLTKAMSVTETWDTWKPS